MRTVNDKGGKRPRGRMRKVGRREAIALRRQQAIALRRLGCSYQRIAEETGVSLNQSWRDVMAALNETREKTAEDCHQLRTLECARLDAWQLALAPKCSKGDAEAIRACVRIQERRARLLGLDAQVAQRLEVNAVSATTMIAVGRPFESLSDAEIVERHATLLRMLGGPTGEVSSPSRPPPEAMIQWGRQPRPPEAPPPVVVDAEPLTMEELYAREIERREAEARKTNGNGGGPH